MRTAWVLFAIAVATTTASAQTVMDGTDSNISPREKLALFEALRNSLTDPFGSQIIGLKPAPDDLICGQFNAKNRMGGYVGFQPFVVNSLTRKMTWLPDITNFDIKHPEAEQRLAQAQVALETIQQACEPKVRTPTAGGR